MVRVTARQTGGNVARAAIASRRATARRLHGHGEQAGIFPESRYPDGTHTAAVAQAHEFGLGVPERPFMRQAMPAIVRRVRRIIAERGLTDVDNATLEAIGQAAAEELRRSAEALTTPPLSRSTVRARQRKGRRVNPLIDTERMGESITHRKV